MNISKEGKIKLATSFRHRLPLAEARVGTNSSMREQGWMREVVFEA